jgi:hypothetical protein
MPLVIAAVAEAYNSQDPLLHATGDCGVISLVFLLHLGEHVYSSNANKDTFPFWLQDVDFIFGTHCYNATTSVILTSSYPLKSRFFLPLPSKRMAPWGKKLKHGSTWHVLRSPVFAILRRVHHLCHSNAPSTTALHTEGLSPIWYHHQHHQQPSYRYASSHHMA